ncbi:MAG: RsmE family RNA methyltransferase [Smithellaceae bacterium]|nr:RsmE family RNA methyltransferase [Smithellaceae bacterium]
MTRPRIFHFGEIYPGMTLRIEGDEFHYLRQVLRLRTKDELFILNGQNGELPGIIRGFDHSAATVEITGPGKILFAPLDITLAQALVKGENMEFLMEKATELGVNRIIPFHARRSIPRLEGEKAKARVGRWQKIAREGARQVGRPSFPLIEDLTTFEGMLSRMPGDSLRLIFWEEEEERGLRDVILSEPNRSVLAFSLVIGPEGGFSREEVAMANDQGFISVSLGRQVLKVETAIISVLAIIHYEKGLWGSSGSREGEK